MKPRSVGWMTLGVLAGVLLTDGAAQTPRLDEAQALVRQVTPAAGAAAQSRDASKRALERAVRLMKDELKGNAACEQCYVTLAAALDLRASLGFGKDDDDTIKAADQGLAQFPANGMLALFKGRAHYRRSEFELAARALNRYLQSPAPSRPEDAEEARRFLLDSRQRFFTTWYNQADFYRSHESRIDRINPQTYQKETVVQITPEYELTLGQHALAELTKGTRPFHDADIQNYLQQLVGRIVQQTPGPPFQYGVSLIDSPEINAVTPPGQVIVYTGLLSFVESESELAGVLAHELAHSYGHHAARRLIKAYQAQMIAAAVQRGINPQSAVSQVLTTAATQLGVGLFLNAYSRFEEKEADHYGTHLLFRAGYNPTAMTAFFVRLYARHPKQPVKFLSTHPPLPDRADYLTDYLEAFPLEQELTLDSDTFKKVVKARFPSPGAPRTTTPSPSPSPSPPPKPQSQPQPQPPPPVTSLPPVKTAPTAAAVPGTGGAPAPAATMRPSEMTVAPTAKVEGTWLFRGVQGEICRIAVTGSELVVLTERREQGRGRVIGPDLIEVAFPFGTLTGKVSPDGRRINWSNGEFWGR